jgi:hypothetical protein
VVFGVVIGDTPGFTYLLARRVRAATGKRGAAGDKGGRARQTADRRLRAARKMAPKS